MAQDPEGSREGSASGSMADCQRARATRGRGRARYPATRTPAGPHWPRGRGAHRPAFSRLAAYWQVGNLKLAMRVLQLKVPLALRYSLVYQKVQSSTGSTVMAL